MKLRLAIVAALSCAVAPASRADDSDLARLATCQDSWRDWQKNDPARLKQFAEYFHAGFSRHDNDAFFVPKTSAAVAGLRVTQVFPDSVGMGVGFSVTVAAKFTAARTRLEKALGHPFAQCEAGDDMRTCALQIADQRTVMLMAEDNAKATTTLIGCYYYYEK